MTEQFQSVEDLDQEALVRLTMDMLQRLILHNGMWFYEVKHQMGLEKAFEMYSRASDTSLGIQLKKLSKAVWFPDAGRASGAPCWKCPGKRS